MSWTLDLSYVSAVWQGPQQAADPVVRGANGRLRPELRRGAAAGWRAATLGVGCPCRRRRVMRVCDPTIACGGAFLGIECIVSGSMASQWETSLYVANRHSAGAKSPHAFHPGTFH